MIVFARDSNRKNKAVPADPGCSGVPGFPYTHDNHFTEPTSNHDQQLTDISDDTGKHLPISIEILDRNKL